VSARFGGSIAAQNVASMVEGDSLRSALRLFPDNKVLGRQDVVEVIKSVACRRQVADNN
jgi:hypothetical protein